MSKITKFLCVLAVLIPFAFLSDGVEAKKDKTRPFKALKIRPRSGDTLVSPVRDIKIKFSKKIDPGTVTRLTVTFETVDGETVDWSFRLNKSGKTLFLIHPILKPHTDYFIRIRGVASVKGERLVTDKSAVFFTKGWGQAEPYKIGNFYHVYTRMQDGRAAHTATVLPDGLVLLAGGQKDYYYASDTADLFLPKSNTIAHLSSSIGDPRGYHAACDLGNGEVMLIGGWNGSQFVNPALDTTVIYKHQDRSFRPGPTMNERRDYVQAVVLQDGRVLVVGGLDYEFGQAYYSKTAEVYDPSTGEFRYTHGIPRRSRAGHTLTLLPDGRVLIVGGTGYPSAEIFEPDREGFTETPTAPKESRQLHNATHVGNGFVLISGGFGEVVEIFNPYEDSFTRIGGSIKKRNNETATLLGKGRVLMAGGFDPSFTWILSTMEVYDPSILLVKKVDQNMIIPMAGHTATKLQDGRVLFAGGFGNYSSVKQAVILDVIE